MVLRIIAGPHPRWQPYLLGGTVGPNLRHTPSVTALRFSRYREQPMPRQIVLASRPSGWPTDDNFALTEADRPDLADGQVRVRNLFMSVDPYMRGRMNNVKSYVPPFRLGEPLEGGAIGTVTESRSPDQAIGDLLLHMLGWRGGGKKGRPDRQAQGRGAGDRQRGHRGEGPLAA